MGSLGNGVVFIVQTLFELYLLVLLLYVLLRASGAHYVNPVIQTLVRISEPLIKSVRKVVPEIGRIDWAAWVVIFFVKFIEVIILMLLTSLSPNILGMLLFSLVGILKLIVNIYFFAIIIFALMSWFQSLAQNPLNHVLYHLTNPILKPVRGLIPLIGGIDLSPLAVLIILQLINIIFLNPFLDFSIGLML